ncbi:FAD/FMN-containing dehydrogenase [Talaromyces proteolyticus]|uniref:FAD/FMN-containing dehydrogenase n=1 Tax=Talaromyces proteolyticus TaxID=1131652 RepID=A0AAD4KCX8_9EURO|nr:FAD/FMN-containing dehydrogenase [Talaromyces proteolyticus]KAH8689019.1 FAD/FMN-containing dehydrogenase [Talaromyces proteolyticus]
MKRIDINTKHIRELTSQLSVETNLVTPSSSEYEDAIKRWSATAVKRAGAVSYPKTASEVSKLVTFASRNNLKLAVKGGGHSTGGTSSTNGGLVIDLSKMRKVTVDYDKKIIIAQGGALWEDVDKAAAEYGLATVGGTVNHTGIGGLTLGGGFGWLSGMHGAVIDNLVSATVVIANGDVLRATETENRDLFWAIRGAGHNFGVAVEFQYKAYDQPDMVYAGLLFFTPDKLGSLVDVLNENNTPRAAVMCVFGVPPRFSSAIIVLICFYNGTEQIATEHFTPVLDLGPIANTLGPIPYAQMNSLLNPMTEPGGRKTGKGAAFSPPIRKEFVESVFQVFSKKLSEEPDLQKSILAIEFYDMTKTRSVAVESTAFPTRGKLHMGIINLSWSEPENDEKFRSWARFLQIMCREEILRVRNQTSQATVFEYANYLEPGDVTSGTLFGANSNKLAVLKARYDPDNLFYKTNPITPATT